MNTTGPLPSLSTAVPAPAASARKAARTTDQDGGGTSFADFLPDQGSAGSPKTTSPDPDAAPATAKLKSTRGTATDDDAEDAAETAVNTARPPGPPMLPPITLLSAQHVTLANPAPAAPGSDIAADATAKAVATTANPVANGANANTAKVIPPAIAPHGPPTGGLPSLSDAADHMTPPTSKDDVAGSGNPLVVPPRITPHGPPETPDDDGPLVVPPRIVPLNPPDPTNNAQGTPASQGAPATKATAAPIIEPHGPPVQPDDTLPTNTAKLTNPVKQPPLPTIEPHDPPTLPDDTAAATMPPGGAVKSTPLLTIEPHGPPDQPDDTVASPTLPPGVTVKSVATPVIEPHGPPVQSDDTLAGGTASLVDLSPLPAKPPLIAPHGPPVGTVDASTLLRAKAVKNAPLPTIEPHGPPDQPDDTLTANAGPTPPGVNPGGMGKLEFTTTLPSPVGVVPTAPDAAKATAAVPVAVLPVPGLSKGEFPTAIPLPATTPPQADVAPSPSLPPPVEITSAMQARLPRTAGSGGSGNVAVPLGGTDLPDPSETDDEPAAPITTLRPAIFAAQPFATTGATGDGSAVQSMQNAQSQRLAEPQDSVGTTAAKQQTIVTAEASNTETLPDRSGLSRRGAATPLTVASTARTAAGSAPVTAAAILPTSLSAPVNADPANAVVPAPATTAPAPTAEHVQKMLQTVLDAGIKTASSGGSQTEMHVRLDGGANDVTVRLRMQDSALHVTFQTASLELRQALERGWSDFTANAAQNAAVTVEPPRFVAAATTGQPAFDFSGGQQNPSRQQTPGNADDAPTVARAPWQGSRPVSATATQPTVAANASRRWTGWA